MVREITQVVLLSSIILLQGCANFKTIDPRIEADQFAAKSNFEKMWIATKDFNFLTYQKKSEKLSSTKLLQVENLQVYIEGDGRSYLNTREISPDPTPHQPLALKLAVKDPATKVVYLARPCQYVDFTREKHCSKEVWSTARFSERVIHNMDQAISILKKTYGAKKVQLIGFSGGAAVAILIAARRNDVAGLRTVAGDLNHERMSAYHHTHPLEKDALNPIHHVRTLSAIPQHHFAGAADKVVPPFISEEFVMAGQKVNPACIRRTLIKNVEHHAGWESAWPGLLSLPLDCKK